MSLSALPLASTLVHVQVEPYSHDALAIWPARTQISFVQKQLWSLDAALPKGAAVVAIPQHCSLNCGELHAILSGFPQCALAYELGCVPYGNIRKCLIFLLYILHYCFWLVQYKILQSCCISNQCVLNSVVLLHHFVKQ